MAGPVEVGVFGDETSAADCVEDDLLERWELVRGESGRSRACDVGEPAFTNFDRNPGAITYDQFED